MKLQPRQQILAVWRAIARISYQDGKWVWGGRDDGNSLSDAEQLLCILLPATEVPAFRLDRPDETGEDVLAALRHLGDSIEIPRLLIRVLTDYMERYTDETGRPVFSGEGYYAFEDPDNQPTRAQLSLDVVDSFSSSVALSLATVGFVRVFRGVITREDLLREVEALEAKASQRLTAAMIGLLRSFTVNVFEADSPEGQVLCRKANQSGLPQRRIIEELRDEMREINARLRDVTIGSGSGQADDLDHPNRLFECGWSWGIVRDAPTIDINEDVGTQVDGVAQPAPYLYFTVVALEAIEALFSERTRLLGLLNEEQSRLAGALQLRWDLTQSYWSKIASFGSGRWPLEDIPWQTADTEESDYFSLLVSSIAVQDLVHRRASDTELSRVGRVLDELANRARITRRPFAAGDPAVGLHSPGVRVALVGTETHGPGRMSWVVSDFSPLLLKRIVRIAGLLRDTTQRTALLALGDKVWDHLEQRRLPEAPGGLWDQPSKVFDQIAEVYEQPSWYYTRRVVECLVTSAEMVGSPPLRSYRLGDVAGDLLSEAEHRFDHELLGGGAEAGPSMRTTLQTASATLARARDVLTEHPGTAMALAQEVLRELDRLSAARLDVTGTT